MSVKKRGKFNCKYCGRLFNVLEWKEEHERQFCPGSLCKHCHEMFKDPGACRSNIIGCKHPDIYYFTFAIDDSQIGEHMCISCRRPANSVGCSKILGRHAKKKI